jgi:protein transport protein SEC39
LLAKVLEQNPKSYTKLDDLLDIGRNLIEAGLPNTKQDAATVEALVHNAEKRVIGMATEAALAEDDFETAYSYVINRLVPSTTTAPQTNSNLVASMQGDLWGNDKEHDDVSWRAAFQAGRFRPTGPANQSRLSASSTANPEIRHLEMRMELLSQSLLLAPGAALPEVLGVWQRCEEELNILIARETEEAEKWDDKGDKRIPGQFVALPPLPTSQREGRGNLKSSGGAPMGLFDVARGAAAALSKSAFPSKGASAASKPPHSAERERASGGPSAAGGDSGSISGTDSDGRVRKRDMVSSMVTGGLASGIGWVLGI